MSKVDEIIEDLKKEVQGVSFEEMNTLIQSFKPEVLYYLLKNKWEFMDKKDCPLQKLEGIKEMKNGICMKDPCVVAIIADAEIDEEKIIARYPLAYLDIAKKLGADEILVTKKNYPCFAKLPKEGRVIVIAPRVKD